jgi:hypothetical protein
MSEPVLLVLVIVATCAFIFGATVLVTPWVERLREKEGVKVSPEISRSKQYRTVAICCVGGALVAAIPVLAGHSPVAAGLAGLLFIGLLALVAVISLRDVRQAKRRTSDQH